MCSFKRYRERPPGLRSRMRAHSGLSGPVRSVAQVAHRREKHDLAQAAGPGQHHHQAVDAEPDAAGRRHPLFERLDERLVVGLRLLVAALELGRLLLEAAALLVGVVELAEGVGDLDPADEGLPALDQARPRSGAPWRRARARPGSRGRRSAGSAPARPSLREQPVDQLAPALGRVGLGRPSPRPAPRGSGARRCRCRSARGSPRAG